MECPIGGPRCFEGCAKGNPALNYSPTERSSAPYRSVGSGSTDAPRKSRKRLGSSHAALHRRVSSFGREVRLLSLRRQLPPPPLRTRGLSCEPIRWLFPYRVLCKEIPHNSRSSVGIESRNPHVPTCCHLRTVYLPALNPIADLFNWCGPGLLLIVWFAHDRGFIRPILVLFVFVLESPSSFGSRGGVALPVTVRIWSMRVA